MDKLDLLVDILETYFQKWELQQFLEEAGLKKSGNKKELAERIIKESDYDFTYLLSRLTKDELFDIVETYFEIKLPKSTTKQELLDIIFENIDMDEIEETETPLNEEIKKSEKEDEELLLRVYKLLKDGFKPYRIENEADLENQLVVYLRSSLSSEIVTPQKAGASRGNIHIPDIVIKNIAVEIKHFSKERKRRDEWDKAIGQVIRYRVDGKYSGVILFLVDDAGIVPDYYKEYEDVIPWLKIIIKK
ncbi:conserved hypothetical protein [Methanocaldococcus sp. FS406-22]|uniref:SAP domain-containing protein n=1 Tax=Methanocaldococcus sp. (strain FS406-22) TaxID=644281 RepID=UPI0001BF1E13|nr:hypothetical protein [Methanocaldococcus sp. FS406-22]ADC70155.1 conserved hypothetical protein [Methanocaldococcus sp. FS406-22]